MSAKSDFKKFSKDVKEVSVKLEIKMLKNNGKILNQTINVAQVGEFQVEDFDDPITGQKALKIHILGLEQKNVILDAEGLLQ